MTTFDTATLHEDANRKTTSSEWDAVNSRWVQKVEVVADSGAGSTGIGAVGDVAVTDPASNASVIAALKGLLTRFSTVTAGIFKAEDAASADGALGIPTLAVRRDTATSGVTADGDWANFSVDSSGRLRVVATRDSTDQLAHATMAALGAKLIVKASAGKLHNLIGYVDSGQDGWIQVFDATDDPGDTTVPDFSYPIFAAADPQPVNIPLPGHVCSTGITVMWSTTGAELTEGAAKMFVTGHYE